jgi:kynurenine formamidase
MATRPRVVPGDAPLHDLTQQLTASIPRFPGDPEVRIEALPGFAPWQVSLLTMGTHSGTHMDAPRHRIAGGAGIGDYPLERLVGRGLVVDARGLDVNEAIPAQVLDQVRDHVWPGWFALIQTGWDRYWGDERYFQHPFVSPELADALVQTDAGLVAIDAMSVDSTADAGSDAHLILLGADVLIAENLRNLDALTPGVSYACAFLPLALGEADGSPARIVAWEEKANRR